VQQHLLTEELICCTIFKNKENAENKIRNKKKNYFTSLRERCQAWQSAQSEHRHQKGKCRYNDHRQDADCHESGHHIGRKQFFDRPVERCKS
jgi:hypothetical protein